MCGLVYDHDQLPWNKLGTDTDTSFLLQLGDGRSSIRLNQFLSFFQ
jgi:hypothetical protein